MTATMLIENALRNRGVTQTELAEHPTLCPAEEARKLINEYGK